MKVGDLIRHTPSHGIQILIDKFGSEIVGILLFNNKEGGTLELLTNHGIYWAVTSDCEKVYEDR